MAKKIFLFGVVLIMVTSLFLLIGCEDDEEDKKTDTLEMQIRKTYWETYVEGEVLDGEFTFDDVYIKNFYGVYDGSVVVIMDIKGAFWFRMVEDITVAGYKFSWTYGLSIRVWRDNKFYSLPEAFEEELLTEDNIREIHELWSVDS